MCLVTLNISDANNSLICCCFHFCLIQFATHEFNYQFLLLFSCSFLFFDSYSCCCCHLSLYSILANNKFMNIIYGQRSFSAAHVFYRIPAATNSLFFFFLFHPFSLSISLFGFFVFQLFDSTRISNRSNFDVILYANAKMHNNQ